MIGKEFEASLTSKSTLNELEKKIDGYARNECRSVVITVYGDAKKSLLDELKIFCDRYWVDTHVDVEVRGSVIKDAKKDDGSLKIF